MSAYQLLRQTLLKPMEQSRKPCTPALSDYKATALVFSILKISSLSLSLFHTHVTIIYGCQVLDQLIAGNPLVNRVLDTLPIDLCY